MGRRSSVGRVLVLLAASTMVATAVPLAGFAEHTPAPASVTIAGSLQDELGCGGDWQPECASTHLGFDSADGVWQGTFDVPAGNWEYKAALDDSWDENYGAAATRDGSNIGLVLGANQTVKFYYSHASHWVTDNLNSRIVTAPGSFQNEIGCPGDWQPDCLRSWLQDPDGDGVFTWATDDIPAGSYEAKVAIGESWDENYGAGGEPNGPNIPFDVAEGDTVSFTFVSETNILTVGIGGLEPGDEDLVRPVLSHPFEDQVLYFLMPDRFSDGDPTNNCGAYTGTCNPDGVEAEVLQHGYWPGDKGYYHGGDLSGLLGSLDYLEAMGVTAIWVGPIFLNKTVQPDSTSPFGVSAGYHGYWILDFSNVDPHLGNNAEFASLVDEAHSRGIKVFMDVVTNHTADVVQLDSSAYRTKADFPYVDLNGDPFDDSDYAYFGQPDYTFPEVDENSFPYTPTVPPGEVDSKSPAWLNDPLLYHNRGNSSFTGENSLYGDFFGLDDLWTERREVVEGMIDIFSAWIRDFAVDGFRIDTTKHVNMEFWQKFGPDILAAAEAEGIAEFFAFGEVFDQQYGPSFLSQFSTRGRLQSTIDFAYQLAARDFASRSGSTADLQAFFELDDYYTDADSNAYAMPTFVGNHDMGRIGYFLTQDNPGASDAELVARSKLAHALMFFTRGQPVIYYGDEQGFVGDGGDKLARQDMFPSQVGEYNDDDLIGTDATTADDNFDPTHPIYSALAGYAQVYADHRALRRGAQIPRLATDGAGVFAFSRIDRDTGAEYLVALNNDAAAHTETVPTGFSAAGVGFELVLSEGGGSAPSSLSTDADGRITVDVPGLGFVIYRASQPIPAPDAAPAIQITRPASAGTVVLGVEAQDGHDVVERLEVAAELDADAYAEITFAVSVDGGAYQPIGTDDNPPYRVFYDTTGLAEGATLAFKAIVKDAAGNLAAAKVEGVTTTLEEPPPPGAAPTYAVVHYSRADGDYGDHTTGDYNDFWGLHLWGDIAETVEWTGPKAFLGEDDYGRFAWVKLASGASNVGLIVHRGDTKDGTDQDRFFDPGATPEIWLRDGDPTIYFSQAGAQGFVTVHYHRDDGDYDGWGVHLWGEAIAPGTGTEWPDPRPPDGTDDFGLYWNIPIQDATVPVNYIIHRGDEKDPGPDQAFVPVETAAVWINSGDETIYTQRGAATGTATIHYHRPDGNYGDPTSSDYNDFWGLHTWQGADDPGWTTPRKPARFDTFGAVFEVPLFPAAAQIGYILHRGDTKDPGPDQFLEFDTWGYEVWQLAGADPEDPYVLPILGGPAMRGDLAKQQAHWVDATTIVWPAATDATAAYQACASWEVTMVLTDSGVGGADGCVDLVHGGPYPGTREGFLHLAGMPTLQLPAGVDHAAAVRSQLAVVATKDGVRLDATGLQIPGVLDDLVAYDGDLGVSWDGEVPTLRVWAPTARNVRLHLFADSDPATEATVLDMTENDGVWSITGEADWTNRFYLYEVTVYAPSTLQVESNLVTDPYSFSLAMNSTRSQIVDLDDPALAPDGWSSLEKPELAQPEDIVIYELHIRDFSVNDPSVPDELKGTYRAFTREDSNGMTHLAALAGAGLTHVHLLPSFDIATIDEDESTWQSPAFAELAGYPSASEEQQALITATEDLDGFNWGYDPWHYTTPEGSYATDPDGSTRIAEYRDMVAALNGTGLRVVMDVVYNHTNASGQAEKSVLDRIVPGYYHRLDQDGAVTTSTCCANTATEHRMMGKLMVDSVLTWAKQYKVDGFRFDLMGHHTRQNMLDVRAALDALTVENDGVDGQSIYLYGEGWNFGEVQNDARFVQATQLNMGGTGIGTFSDRLRDAVRGGGPFDGGLDLRRNQGVINGLWYDPNEEALPVEDALAELLLSTDQIKVGLAGNLADHELIDRNGNLVPGSAVDYNGSPAGYTEDPQENIVYVSAHDNQTLFDISQYHHPVPTAMADRVRAQNLGIDFTALAQGVPFFHAGVDMLRSKSLDRDSFNSGDWFNRLDFTYADNAWGSGLPVASKNQDNWPIQQPLLADPDLKPDAADIAASVAHLREMLEIRGSSPLFRLPTAAEIDARVGFDNAGPDQVPGVVVMTLDDTVGPDIDPRFEHVVVVFNATDDPVSYPMPVVAGAEYELHPVQESSADPVVQTAAFDQSTGTFSVPARTTAVFVTDITPPQVDAGLGFLRGNPRVGWYEVGYSCTDADPNTTLTADLNGVTVVPGAVVRLIDHPNRTDWESKSNRIDIHGRSFRLTVTCSDSSANTTTVTVAPLAGGGPTLE